MTIIMYGLREPRLETDKTLEDLITMEREITYGSSPSQLLPSGSTFKAEEIAVSFFNENTGTISRKQATLVVRALWNLTWRYGPRTIRRTDIVVGGVIVAHVILYLSGSS